MADALLSPALTWMAFSPASSIAAAVHKVLLSGLKPPRKSPLATLMLLERRGALLILQIVLVVVLLVVLVAVGVTMAVAVVVAAVVVAVFVAVRCGHGCGCGCGCGCCST